MVLEKNIYIGLMSLDFIVKVMGDILIFQLDLMDFYLYLDYKWGED